nr:MAG TPA: hypothetical protein [Caudoviricetes sp.]
MDSGIFVFTAFVLPNVGEQVTWIFSQNAL